MTPEALAAKWFIEVAKQLPKSIFDKQPMTIERIKELDENPRATLTEDELRQGWHWCGELDGDLVGPDKETGKLPSFCQCDLVPECKVKREEP